MNQWFCSDNPMNLKRPIQFSRWFMKIFDERVRPSRQYVYQGMNSKPFSENRTLVAQAASLLYRRLPACVRPACSTGSRPQCAIEQPSRLSPNRPFGVHPLGCGTTRRATPTTLKGEHPASRSARSEPGPPTSRRLVLSLVLLAALLLVSGCSIRRMAVNKLGDALAGGGTTFASDDDPELVKAAVPFSLKLMESLLNENPRHEGLLFATASGFTQYAYAFVQQDADEMEDKDFAAAEELRGRARRLYLRARNYGQRGLEIRHRGWQDALHKEPKQTVRSAAAKDVPLLYWTAVSWAAAISVSKDQPDLIADMPIVEALVDRALELDETFGDGAIHSFLITYEMSRPGGTGEAVARSKQHFDRAIALSHGQLAGPFVSFAEAVCVQKQDLKEFESLLHRALEINPDAKPEWRLVNLVLQRRAKWLLARTDQLFLKRDSTEESKPQ
jgi:predicted anti-sigma-YlaC factor YlaD